MPGYRLHLTNAGIEAVDDLEHLDDLAERIALEQLAHELNPVNPAGYVVAFRVITQRSDSASTAADGHFYVRAATEVAPVERSNRPT